MTKHHLRVLASYRDVYSNRNDTTYGGMSVAQNNTIAGSSYMNDPYVRNFSDTGGTGGTRDVTTLVLFIILMTFSTCLVLFRISRHCDGQDALRREQLNNHQQHQSSDEIRTQETIEKMIVLKKVLSASARDLDLSRSRKGMKRIERRKSNLFLRSNKTGDELDLSRTCPICLCEYENGESICWSHNKQCAHHFHAQCGIAWLAKHTECPICRANYLVQPPSDDQKDNNTLPLSEPRENHVITIIESDEDPPENLNEEQRQQSIETMEQGGINPENSNDTTIQRSDEELCGVIPTDSDTQPVSTNVVWTTHVENNQETVEQRPS